MNDIISAIVQIITALGGLAGIGAALKWGAERRAARIDATKAITDTAVGLLTPLRVQIGELSADLAQSRAEAVALRDDVRGLHEWIGLLIDALEEAGRPVPPRPSALPPVPSPASAQRRGRPSSESS